jgi:hypothetical protein
VTGTRGGRGRPGCPGAIGKQGPQGLNELSVAVRQRESLDGLAAHFEGIYDRLTALAQRIVETELREIKAGAKDRR